ncbi:CDP-alcohol phosphatidyltransferase family protein [Marinimicrobium sp. LS-A18]|uniref:CDP-alcohol phosphatidyltransferase family protein n=1 Tax=Marinimicrobium sp. LS-A18 TaxID=1381596 RepID=UPI000466793D|nr:CDP-alcohol phosphatidyltransferase family protein [Marinimicrobium sp. LS-A18]
MTESTDPHSTPELLPPSLTRDARRWLLAGGLLLMAGALVLAGVTGTAEALRWFAVVVVVWSLVGWQCYRRLHLNRGAMDVPLFNRLGAGNHTTLARGLLIAATAGFVVLPSDSLPTVGWYLPALFYTAAALGDGLDGYLARRQDHTTRLGAELDTELDALGLVVAPILAVMHGKLHASYLLVSLAYYLFQWGIYWRRQRERPVYPLPPSRMRRYLAGLQMALVAIVLWPPVPPFPSQVAGAVVMTPLLIGFIRDWLHVSGRLGEHTS